MKKNLSVLMASLGIFLLLIFGIVYADTNGVWHRSEDVRVGTFGNDEGDNSNFYNFINPVGFNSDVFYKNVELDLRYINHNDSSIINSSHIVDGSVSNSDINFNYAISDSKGGNATNSNSCTGDGVCEIGVGDVSSELRLKTIRSNSADGSVIIQLG